MNTRDSPLRVHDDLLIPVHGETVSATRWEPEEISEEVPALFMYTPYHKDDRKTFGSFHPLITSLASSGYEVVVADMLGTGASSGEKLELFTQSEGEEAATIIEWIADQPWNNGRVGMFGQSYGGITTLYAASKRPPALEAIVPIQTPYTGYRNGFVSAGVPEFANINLGWLSLMQLLDIKPPCRRDSEGRWMEVWKDRLQTVRDRDPWLFQFMDHQTKDEFWKGKDIHVDQIGVPTFAVGSWKDGYVTETIEYFEAIDAPKHLLLGPWRHRIHSPLGFRPRIRRWFDRYLKHQDDGFDNFPPITLLTEHEVDSNKWGGSWRQASKWPTLDASGDLHTFAATSDGLAPLQELSGAVERIYEFDPSVGLHSYAESAPKSSDTRSDDLRSLTFDTDALDSSIEFTGTGEVTASLESSVTDPLLVVRVINVAPDGTGRLVTWGVMRLRYRDGPEQAVETTPGEEYHLSIPLRPVSHTFPAGHRIRLAFSAALFPQINPPQAVGDFTLRSTPESPTALAFPVGEHATVLTDEQMDLDTPGDGYRPSSANVLDSGGSWWVAEDWVSGMPKLRTEGNRTIQTPYATVTSQTHQSVKVRSEPPYSLTGRYRQDMEMRYAQETVRIRVDNDVSREFVRLESEVTIDNRTVFHETWCR